MESWNEQLKTKILESEFSIKEISDKTKIPTKFIEAIEKADFKNLPAEIFAKLNGNGNKILFLSIKSKSFCNISLKEKHTFLKAYFC